ncbi:MAG: hypothetical protein U5N86_10030 [Planctomycetota bacterium]|nr:hypothetical protein [Planctomycetota bacterium]
MTEMIRTPLLISPETPEKPQKAFEGLEEFEQFFRPRRGLPAKARRGREELTEAQIIEKFHKVLKIAKEIGASDLFLKVDVPPSIRHDGNIQFLKFDEMTENECQIILEHVCDKYLIEEFRSEHEIDAAYQVDEIGRFGKRIPPARVHWHRAEAREV